MPADVVGLTHSSFGGHQAEGTDVVFDVEPVPDLIAFAVYRQGLTFQSIENYERDEFFRELVGAVVVGAVLSLPSAVRMSGTMP